MSKEVLSDLVDDWANMLNVCACQAMKDEVGIVGIQDEWGRIPTFKVLSFWQKERDAHTINYEAYSSESKNGGSQEREPFSDGRLHAGDDIGNDLWGNEYQSTRSLP